MSNANIAKFAKSQGIPLNQFRIAIGRNNTKKAAPKAASQSKAAASAIPLSLLGSNGIKQLQQKSVNNETRKANANKALAAKSVGQKLSSGVAGLSLGNAPPALTDNNYKGMNPTQKLLWLRKFIQNKKSGKK